ncbi:LTA synthase family protein [Francisella sciaenopsi]|uniref:LTA synthase family protein n=1 Tax=Francisella sciaenopsi TaxID=3055034 RepID=A0ABQ6PED0_9GAMM
MSSTIIIISITILATILNKSIKLGFYNALAFCWIYSLIGIFIYSSILCLIISIVLLGVISGIDSAKYKILKERFQYEDLFLYSQVFRFPKFYIPFVGAVRFWTLTIGILCATGLIFYLNYIWLNSFDIYIWFTNVIFFITINIIIHRLVSISRELAFVECISQFGMHMTVIVYIYRNRAKITKLKSPSLHIENLPKTIITVQSESYILADQIFDFKFSNDNHAYSTGKLEVPCYGAYTMRSEFAFLTGITNSQLGHASFNPYRKAYKNITQTYIKQLKKLGYYCVVIHPFNKKFFNREKVFKHLGFDEFIDEFYFNKIDIFTPDAQLTDYIKQYLDQHSDRKIFMFVITIAGHGPYTLPRNDPRVYNANNSDDEVNVYLDLNYKATQMLKSLEQQINKDSMLIWYGDHKPSIQNWSFSQSELYQTNYIIITNPTNSSHNIQQDISIENLLEYSLKRYSSSYRSEIA